VDQCFKDVIAFEKAAGHELSNRPPDAPDNKTLLLRMRLIREEYDETMAALAKLGEWTSEGEDGPSPNELLAELADGLADLIWVCVGTAIHFGLDLPECWSRVRAANMAKFAPGSSVREDGKRLKPPGWVAPDIIGSITSQKPLAETYETED
jgi:predicted HAD superfamily Cof-like phosphohydrolase